MKKIIALLLIVCMCAGLCACMPNLKKYALEFASEKTSLEDFDEQGEEYAEFLKKLAVFSSKLSAEVCAERADLNNVGISPISAYMSLAIACEMSGGETREQILDAVGVSYDELQGFTKYLYSLCNREFLYDDGIGREGVSSFEQLSNSVWFADDVSLNLSISQKLAQEYNCDVYKISFKDGDANKMINQYIEYKTHGLIKTDIKLPYDSAFSLINTFYLKEIWNSIGRELSLTLEEYKFINEDESIKRTQLLKGNYGEGKVYESTEYFSFYTETYHGFRLYFILPKEEYSLKNVFTHENITDILSVDDFGYVDEEKHELHYTRALFPEFSASFSGDISGILAEKFGVTDLFDQNLCNVSGAISSKAYCQNLIHNCELKVDTKGIEGSAATVIPGASSPETPEYKKIYHDFIINGAFGFILVDEYGTILYSGTVNNLE